MQTNIKIEAILENLKQWRDARHLTIEMQRENVAANITEEILEHMRAKDNNERIDALCDIVVFALNAYADIDKNNTEDVYFRFPLCPPERSKEFVFEAEIFRLLGSILMWQKMGNRDRSIDNELWWIIINCYEQIDKLGYDFFIAMDETIKEIESRQGEWHEDIKKFVKYDGAYSKDDAVLQMNRFVTHEDDNFWYFNKDRVCKWYPADYSKAKK